LRPEDYQKIEEEAHRQEQERLEKIEKEKELMAAGKLSPNMAKAGGNQLFSKKSGVQ